MKKFITPIESIQRSNGMDVIIRNVPSKAYREFKSRAAKTGLRLGEALKRAMEEWTGDMEGSETLAHDPNDLAFRRMRATLERKYRGKYVALSSGQLVAVADSLEALGAVLRRKKITRSRTAHLCVDEEGEGGEWLWGSIEQEIASATTTR